MNNSHNLKGVRRLIITMVTIMFCFAIDAQNLVPNPNFTEIDTCPYSFGQIHFAPPWRTDNEQTPDLYDSCDISGFYEIPLKFSCVDLLPKMDNGFVGIVSYGTLPNGNSIREVFSASLVNKPKLDVDIFCSMSVSPRPRCILDSTLANYTCYANSLALAILFENQSKEIIIESEDIIDNIGTWRTLKGCYEPKGKEARVQIQNYKADVSTISDCYTISTTDNIAYTFIDNVVVAPFDILPDTLVVCDVDSLQFKDLNFYDLPLSWSDDVDHGPRLFNKTGQYQLIADADNCLLEEAIQVIVLDAKIIDPLHKVIKCLGRDVTLQVDIPGEVIWDNQQTGTLRTVSNTGIYNAMVTTECNVIELTFQVSQSDCNDIVYAPNIFSPNNDDVNESIEFYIDPEIPVRGELLIYNRWGNLVFRRTTDELLIWDGNSQAGVQLAEGVYIWVFRNQEKTIVQSGDITLIR